MTLLCLVLTDDAVLLAADSASNLFEDPQFWQPFPAVVPREKIEPTGVPTVMWGYSGFQTVVQPVIDWAASATWGSWEQLLGEVQDRCNEANARARRIVRARGLSADDVRLLRQLHKLLKVRSSTRKLTFVQTSDQFFVPGSGSQNTSPSGMTAELLVFEPTSVGTVRRQESACSL